jgi:putative IMPACT (imprinted ancient) family translation regulator
LLFSSAGGPAPYSSLFKAFPASRPEAVQNRHNRQGGLLAHTLSVALPWPQKRPFAAAAQGNHGERLKSHGDGRLLLPSALLVTVQTQLLAAFVFVNFCLAAFF